MKDDAPVTNRAIHCQNLIFNSRAPLPGNRKKKGEPHKVEPLTGLDSYQRLILLALNDMIGSNKTSWAVCQKELAERCACSPSSVKEAIRSLVAAGILTRSYKSMSGVLTYSINPEPLVPLQREPRSARVRQAGWSPRGQEVAAPQPEGSRPAASSWPAGDQGGPAGDQGGPPRGYETVPSTASVPVRDQPSAGTLPSEQGGGLQPDQGRKPSNLNRKPATLEDALPVQHRALILEVQKEVTFHDSRIPIPQLARELTQFFDDFGPALEARDLINALRSPSWKGLNEMSWGLLLHNDTCLDRLITQVGASIREREEAANARTTPAATLAEMLASSDPCERLRGLNCYADRFEQTKDSAWLVRLAAVFAGKGRDELPKIRRHALERLGMILGRDNPELPEPVRRAVVSALRKAAQDDELRVIASSALEFCGEVAHA